MGSTAGAQGLLGRLGERAKNAVEENIGNKVEQGVNDILNGKKKDKKNNKGKEEEQAAEAAPAPEEQPAVSKPAPVTPPVATAYAKTDFVPGDEIFFDDDFANEQLGEFPLRWELLDGYVETASVAGRKVLAFTDNGIGQVLPNMKEKWAWLPEDFTVEYDLFIAPLTDEDASTLSLGLCFGAPGQSDYYNAGSEVAFQYREDGSSSISWSLTKPDGNNQIQGSKALGLSDNYTDYAADSPVKPGEWNHFAFSFNKRAFKGYINGVRLINVPAMQAPGYHRLMSEGKIVTYAITFETGKADLKPESMVEILRVAKLMKENPGLEFEVQGHCDSTGSDKVNDPLSQKRAEAIVAALVEQDIAETRLSPVGKGSHAPIASNSTEEGRAKNRRVEFVKK